jgi:hypothetical protein
MPARAHTHTQLQTIYIHGVVSFMIRYVHSCLSVFNKVTPWTIHVKETDSAQLVKTSTVCGTRAFTVVLITDLKRTLCSVQSTYIYLMAILILSLLHLGLPSGLFPSTFRCLLNLIAVMFGRSTSCEVSRSGFSLFPCYSLIRGNKYSPQQCFRKSSIVYCDVEM